MISYKIYLPLGPPYICLKSSINIVCWSAHSSYNCKFGFYSSTNSSFDFSLFDFLQQWHFSVIDVVSLLHLSACCGEVSCVSVPWPLLLFQWPGEPQWGLQLLWTVSANTLHFWSQCLQLRSPGGDERDLHCETWTWDTCIYSFYLGNYRDSTITVPLYTEHFFVWRSFRALK